MKNAIKKVVSNRHVQRAAAGVAMLGASAAALADDPVTAAMSDATTKVGGYGAGLVALAAVGVGFSVGIKYLKKIARAA